MSVIYSKRRNLFEKGETEWRVEDDALVRRDPEGHEQRFFWTDLTGVRIGYAPTRWKTQRHNLVLTFGSADIEIDNQHFAGVGDFADRSAAYTPFARAVLAKAAATHPDLMVRVGAKPSSYVLNLLFVGVTFAALLIVLIVLPVNFGFYIILKLVLIVAMLPVFVRWIRHARPRLVRPDALPDDALPPEA